MPRSGKITKREIAPDQIYNSRLVAKLINRVMRSGKKDVAEKLVYSAFDIAAEKTGKSALEVFRDALENIKPNLEVKARRIGGATYQVPIPVRGDRKESLGICWLVRGAQERSNKEYKTFPEKLAAEIVDAAKNEGVAVKRKQETQRLADANKAFAHFRW